MFSSLLVCLFVCLFNCEQDYGKTTFAQIFTKFGGKVAHGARKE